MDLQKRSSEVEDRWGTGLTEEHSAEDSFVALPGVQPEMRPPWLEDARAGQLEN